MIPIKGEHIALPVKNLENTIEFYSKLLGMQLHYRTKYYDKNFVIMKLSEHRISFFESPDNVPLPPWLFISVKTHYK